MQWNDKIAEANWCRELTKLDSLGERDLCALWSDTEPDPQIGQMDIPFSDAPFND